MPRSSLQSIPSSCRRPSTGWKRSRFLLGLAGAAALLVVGTPTAAETPTLQPPQRLASELARTAATLASGPAVATRDLTAAWALQSEACRLDPTSESLARRRLEIALLLGDETAIDTSLRAVNALDPADDVVQLARLMRAIDDRYQTAGERIEALTWLIGSDRQGLGDAVRSRVALDLALLHRRTGALDAFAATLSTAVSLDASNRDAASIAAGFFRTHVDDPVAEAELLVNLLLSDPTDPSAIVTFAKLLIDRGATVGAARFFELAVAMLTEREMYTDVTLNGDRLLAHLANGDVREFDSIMARQQKLVDFLEAHRRRSADPDRDWSVAEIDAIRGTIHPVLRGLQALRFALDGDSVAQAEAVAAALNEYESMWNGTSANSVTNDVRGARLRLEAALIAMMFGSDDDVARVDDWIKASDAIFPLTASAFARFEGWTAVREGRFEDAIASLTEIAVTDGSAGLALGHAADWRQIRWRVGRFGWPRSAA